MQSFANLFDLPHHKSRRLAALYVVALIRTFVFLLLGLFLPILLFKLFLNQGYNENNALLLVILVFLTHIIVNGLLIIPVSKINMRFGTKTGFFISQSVVIIFLFILFFSQNAFLIFVNFMLWGVAAVFYWVSYHTFFLEVGNKKRFGEELGLLEMLGIFSGSVAPVFAGLVIMSFGFAGLFFLCILLTFVSMFVLYYMRDTEKLESASLLYIKKEIVSKKRDFISFIGAGGVEIIYSVAWPLLLFTVFEDYLKIGTIASLVVLTSVSSTLIAGKLSDRLEKNKIEKIGSASVAVTFVTRIFFQTPASVYIIDSLYKIFSNLFYLPLNALAYNHAVDGNKTKYVVFREIGYRTGNILGLLVFLLVLCIKIPFWWVFIFAALFSLLPMVINEA